MDKLAVSWCTMVETISRWESSSVPKKGSLLHTLPKMPVNQDFSKIYLRENTNVPIPGYLYSIEMEPAMYRYSTERQQPIYRKSDKPRWQLDVCVAIPNHCTFGIGGCEIMAEKVMDIQMDKLATSLEIVFQNQKVAEQFSVIFV